MCFDIGSQHRGCWGQNTSRIQIKKCTPHCVCRPASNTTACMAAPRSTTVCMAAPRSSRVCMIAPRSSRVCMAAPLQQAAGSRQHMLAESSASATTNTNSTHRTIFLPERTCDEGGGVEWPTLPHQRLQLAVVNQVKVLRQHGRRCQHVLAKLHYGAAPVRALSCLRSRVRVRCRVWM
jgi:hypothetical protein